MITDHLWVGHDVMLGNPQRVIVVNLYYRLRDRVPKDCPMESTSTYHTTRASYRYCVYCMYASSSHWQKKLSVLNDTLQQGNEL